MIKPLKALCNFTIQIFFHEKNPRGLKMTGRDGGRCKKDISRRKALCQSIRAFASLTSNTIHNLTVSLSANQDLEVAL